MPPTAIVASSIFTPIAKPIADVLAGFYAVIPNFGVAILLLSVVWMIVIAPLTLKSTRSMLAMQKLQPELKKLQAEHRNDRQAFAQAQMELFKEHGVSPFGSCLPTILPLPVFFALFRVIDGLSHHTTKVVGGVKTLVATPSFLSPHTAMYKAIVKADGHINAFGLDLSKNALSGHSSLAAALPFYALLLVMIGTQYLQTVQMMSRNPAAADNPQMKFMKFVPLIFGVICVRFPAGVILNYAASNLCRIAQQTLMYRYDPKVKALASREILEVEATTKKIDREEATPQRSGGRFRAALAQAADQRSQVRTTPAKGGSAANGSKGTGANSGKAGTPGKSSAAANRRSGATNGKATGAAKAGSARSNAKKSGATNGSASNGSTNGSRAGAASKSSNGAAADTGATEQDRAAPPNGKATPNGKPTPNGTAAPSNGGGANGSNGNGESPKPPARSGGGRTGAQSRRTPRKGGR